MSAQHLLILAAALSLAACTTVPTSKPLSNKERHAEALMQVVPPEVMFAQLAEPYAQVYALPHKQEKAHANFMRNVDVAELNRIIRDALLKHFTEAELKALADFYSSPEGRACMTKVAAFASDVVPACSHEAAKAFRKTALDDARNLLMP